MLNTERRWPIGGLAALLTFLGVMLVFQYHFNYSYEETLLFIEIIAVYCWIAGLLLYAKAFSLGRILVL